MDNDQIAIVISIVSFLASFIYTWRTTDKYGLRSKIYEKKLEVCLKLIELIKEYEFFYEILISQNTSSAGRFYITKDMNHFKTQYNMFKDVPVYIDKYVYNKLFKNLEEIKNSAYLDKSIVKSLTFFDSRTMLYFQTPNSDFARITFNNLSNQYMQTEDINTLGKFIDKLRNVLVVSEKWVNKASSIKYRLNI